MNIVLIDLARRSTLFRVPIWMPVYLPSVAAVLRNDGHQVSLVERRALEQESISDDSLVQQRLKERLLQAQPQVILFDVKADNSRDIGAFAETARHTVPDALLLAGGRHPTLCPEETVEYCAALDGVLIGEAENLVCAVARGTPLTHMPSTVSRHDGKLVRTKGDSPVCNLDFLSLPAWDLLDMNFYTRSTPRAIPCLPLKTATLESSRGCRGNCTFCAEGRFNSKVHRFHSSSYVRDAIERLISEYGVEAIYFCDETFLENKERVILLCEELMRHGLDRRIRWSAQVRVDSVTPELLLIMRKAGCVQLEFGIESGSQRVLDSLAKGTTVEQNLAALRISREAGVRSLVYIMYGIPGETREDLRLTAQFLARSRPDIVRFNAFIIYPGAPITHKLAAEGVLSPGFWRENRGLSFAGCESSNVSAMSHDVLRCESRRLYLRHVFPRYAFDYLAHNRPTDIFVHFEQRAVLSFLWKRIAG